MRKRHWLPWICLTFGACSNAKPIDDGASGAYTDIVFGNDVQFGKKDATSSGGDVGPVDSSPEDTGGLSDSSLLDVATGSDATGTADASPDSALDASSDIVATTGCEFPANPTPGASGAACTGNTDCDSGYCVDSPSGKICSQTCLSCCPTGFHCGQISGSSDSSYVCLAQFIALCRPCTTDAECGAINAGALCISAGADGSFCGGACSKDADCPGGYGCQAVQGEKGAGQQCVRLSGTCTCSEKSIFDGAATTCAQKNSFGSCSGTRKCALSGLTACSAATPAQEVCNGKDDNCDGITDGSQAVDCVNYWKDGDGDGAGVGASQCACAPVGLYTATTNGDCDDDAKAVHPGAKEICNDIDDNCNGLTDEGCDKDGDGYCDAAMVIVGSPVVCKYGTKDCNDLNPNVHPNAPEICGNGVDDDCNGVTDDNASTTFYLDSDGDGFGNSKVTQLACAKPPGYVTVASDCDDNNAAVHPGAAEICDGLDNDCDGVTDGVGISGCTPFYTDSDGDGDGTGVSSCLCKATGLFTATNHSDCDDSNAAVHPGATEVCNGVDDNCDGVTDEEGATGCVQFYPDVDGDGYGANVTGHCLCGADGVNTVKKSGDCDDTNANIHPKASEVCNGLDDDCDGVIDPINSEGCSNYYLDGDGDGYGLTSAGAKCQCTAAGLYTALLAGDCDDTAKTVFPGATEVCNGVDDNCNGQIDEGVTTLFYVDADKDGYGAPAVSVAACSAPPGYVADNTDCDGSKASVHPGAAEVCNGIDDNCNGLTDEGVGQTWYQDSDGDGYGSNVTSTACSQPAGYVSDHTDCDDTRASVHPGAIEVCNGLDDNCNGQIDEGVGQTWYQDSDGDSYGSSVVSTACVQPTGYVAVSGDCNDAVASTHPGATEICNGVDDNCNGQTDEGVKLNFYLDFDGDKYGDTTKLVQACSAPAGYVSDHTDCDDTRAYVHPGATEVCNGLDDNCNGAIDEGVTTLYFTDGDGDGYGTGGGTAQCAAGNGKTATVAGDCNDANAAIHPGVTEVCDGVDNNCNGQIDEGVTTKYYQDFDGDLYGNALVVQNACTMPAGYVTNKLDCNDNNAAVNPAATEVCDGVDNNCNGQIDEGLTTTYYQDFDNDTFGNPLVSKVACTQPAGYVTNNLDCNDGNAAINPNATEACGPANAPNGIDENCNGVTDENCTAAVCSGSTTLVDFTNTQGGHGWSLGNGWKDGGSNNFWGAAWALVYSNDPGNGYKSGTNSASGTITIPAGKNYVEFDVGAFSNVRYDDGQTPPNNTGYDTNVYMTFTISGATPVTLANKGSTLQYNVPVKVAIPAGVSGNVTATVTVVNAQTSTAYYGGFSVLTVKAVCN